MQLTKPINLPKPSLGSLGALRRKKGSGSAVAIADYLTTASVFSYVAPSATALGKLHVDMSVNLYPNEAWKKWRLVTDIVLRNTTRA